MKAELTVDEKFEYIVEDSFYSTIHNGIARVDDFSNMYLDGELHFEGLTDGMIEVLYREWENYQKSKLQLKN